MALYPYQITKTLRFNYVVCDPVLSASQNGSVHSE